MIFGVTVENEPEKVHAIALKIVPIAIPSGFEGIEARTADNSLFRVNLAKFKHAEGRGKLVMGQLHTRLVPIDDEYEFRNLQMLLNQISPGMRNLDVKERREVEILVDGKKVTIEVVDGVDIGSTTRIRQVSGAWSTADFVVQILLQVEESFYTNEDIDAMVRSLGTPLAKETIPGKETPPAVEHQ
ncbi:MAG: hypothetical protein WCJ09_11120 [Planctomycetota bacterium]